MKTEIKLSDAISLVQIDTDNHRIDYRYIYKNGKRIRKTPYRVGGFGGNYRDGYVSLLKYTHAQAKKGSGWGTWVLIDENGKEVYSASGPFEKLYHLGGIIAASDQKYYNIKTNELICQGYSSINSKNHLFVRNYIEGVESVYHINIHTGEVNIFQ